MPRFTRSQAACNAAHIHDSLSAAAEYHTVVDAVDGLCRITDH